MYNWKLVNVKLETDQSKDKIITSCLHFDIVRIYLSKPDQLQKTFHWLIMEKGDWFQLRCVFWMSHAINLSHWLTGPVRDVTRGGAWVPLNRRWGPFPMNYNANSPDSAISVIVATPPLFVKEVAVLYESIFKLDSYGNTKASSFFIGLSHAHFHFWDHERLSNRWISKRYPKSDATPWVGKKVQLQEHFMLMTQDSAGHLKTLCISILLLSDGVESEWKHCSSTSCVEKTISVWVWIQLLHFCLSPTPWSLTVHY